MRTYLCLLFVLAFFFAAPANAAQLPVLENSLATCLDEIKLFDIQLTNLQAAWEKETARIEGLQLSVQGKQAAYDKAKEEYAGKQAWLKFNRRQKTVDALDVLAQVYQHYSTTLLWSEGRAQNPDSGKSDDAAQALRLAESDARDKAAKNISDKVSPAVVWSLLDHPPIVISMEKVAADSSGGFGKPVQVKFGEGSVFEARARLQVKPAATNPYEVAAQARRAELKIVRLELLGQYPILNDSPFQWDLNLAVVKPSGEAIQEKTLLSLSGVISDGELRLTREILDREFPEVSGASCQYQLMLKLPQGINGDAARLEVVLRDREPKALKRVLLSLQGVDGAATYEYQSFTPPIISLSAGLTSLLNSRMRVGESVIRFDPDKTGVTAVEMKNGEIAAYSTGKLTRKIQYDGKLGQLKSLSLTMPSSIVLDSVKLYDSGIIVMSEEFNREGESSVRLNTIQLTK